MTWTPLQNIARRMLVCVSVATLCCFAAISVRAEIRIGVAGPLSGQFEAFGRDIVLGAEQAAAAINKAGGIDGEPIRIVAEDDACTEDGGRDAANRLIGARVSAVIGHVCWRASVAGSALYHANDIVQISPATRYAKFTDERPDPSGGTYRLIGRADEQARFLARLLLARHAGLRIGIAHDNSPYGKGLATEVENDLTATGDRPVIVLEYEPGKDEYRALVSRLNDAGAEILFLGGYFGDAAVIVRDMRARGMTVPLIGADALGSSEFWVIAGEAGNGTVFSAPIDPRRFETARAVVPLLARDNQPAQPYSLYAYAALQVLAEALRMADASTKAELDPLLNGTTFDTVLGNVRFDSNGDAEIPSYSAFEWRDGEVVRLEE